MTNWPRGFEQPEPVVSHCPEACPFRELCPTRTQLGIRQLFDDGQYTSPSDCGWWERLVALVRREFGGDTPVPADTAAFKTLLRTRIDRAPF